MQLFATLIDDNLRLLRPGAEVVRESDDPTYARVPLGAAQAAVDGHGRHIIDHGDCLCDGLADGRIDCDRRERSPRIESDRTAALERLDRLELDALRSRKESRPCAR